MRKMLRGKEIRVNPAAGTRRLRAVALTLAALVVTAAPASVALADTSNVIEKQHTPPTKEDGWQAGTCTEEPPESSEVCSIATPGQFFEQAGGHPQWGFTQFIVKHTTVGPLKTPEREVKTIRVDLPVGLSVNPQATPQCKLADFKVSASSCPPESLVGESAVTTSLAGVVTEPTPPLTQVPVYNLEPKFGEPALFGLELASNEVFLRSDVAWESDYHEGFTIDVPETLPTGLGGLVLKNRLVFNGRSGNGTFITTPTTCLGPATVAPFEHVYSTWLRADSWSEPDPNFPNGSSYFESPIPSEPLSTPTFPKECDSIPFEPSIEVDPKTTQTDSPSGARVNVELPFEVPTALEKTEELTKQASSQLKDATVSLPVGMGLNPSAANGLVACTDAQFGKGTKNPVECPAASKVGTVAVQTPPLPPDSLAGNVYLGQQLSRDPTSGNEYRIFVDVESPGFGISARLIGNVAANPLTGQLTTTFAENPQVPFSSFLLEFNGGATAPLTSPPTCGPNATTGLMVPWSSIVGSIPVGEGEGEPSGGPPAAPSDEFTLTAAPGGGACAKTLAARPFAPGFSAGSAKTTAGAFSPFHMNITRQDGEQELKGAEVTLPPGLTAKLAGLTYCPEAALAAAAANSGAIETAKPSCPASSLVGTASVLSGAGSQPLHIDGKAFLAGPYHGAPLSLAVVTPATAGPFDLGTVVVRVALSVDPATAQVRAISDPIPHVFGGALLHIRSIAVNLDRQNFSLNPTNCSPMAISGTLHGGGANPADPAAFSSFGVSVPFQANGCDKLGFEPKLFLRLFGATRRAKNPRLRAVFVAHPGDANPARVAVTLPHSIILDQSNISKVCTRVQFAAKECPANSIYGYARAFTPLLDKPLEGPVFLRSSDNLLPDLVAALRGQVEIDLAGRTDSVKGRLRNTFDVIPDVPVSKFVLTVKGGHSGLLVNSRNLCPHHKSPRKPLRVKAQIRGQNGKTANQRPKLRLPCGGKARHRSGKHA
ncbi:MAG: hypothetical protein WBM00_01775 [Solirubrobacterales bacterium]